MPTHVQATCEGAVLDARGRAFYKPSACPPDYVASDDYLL